MSKIQLVDSFLIDGVKRTSDGYLAAFARVARTGIQTYKGKEVGRPDLETVNIYRPAEEVFHKDAMKSMAHRPITLTHPKETVNARNWKKFSIGHTGQDVVRDGEFMRVPMLMMDAAAIQAYEKNGVKELSLGYSTELKWGKGKTADGQTYDAVQTEIRGNHLAMVPVARGGEQLRIGDFASVMRHMNDQEDVCPKCGAEVDDDEDDCPKCGYDIQDDPENLIDADTSAAGRRKEAAAGQAMPDGSFPIKSAADVGNAVKDWGRAGSKPAVKAHIISRAKALGAEKELPDDWVKSTTRDAWSHKGDRTMSATVLIDGAGPIEVADALSANVINTHIKSLKDSVTDANVKILALDTKLKTTTDEAGKVAAELKKSVETKDGEIAVLKKQVADAALTPEKLDALVKDRGEVIAKAAKILDKSFKFDGVSLSDIRKAAVVAKLGDGAKALTTDAAIEGAFAALTVDAKGSGNAKLKDAIQRQGQDGTGTTDVRDAAFAEMENRQKNAWKTGAHKPGNGAAQ